MIQDKNNDIDTSADQKEINMDEYTFIRMIDSKKNVSLVRYIDGKNYVQKEYEQYNKTVFERLCDIDIDGIPKFYACYEDNGKLYTIEEYISGSNLNDVLKKEGLFSDSDVIDIAIQLCEVIEKIHSLNPPLIHRDIKPSNIIRKRNGKIVLIDFNATKELSINTSQDTVLLGTHYFAAPEQLLGYGASDERTDIYGIGATMNYLLTEMAPSEFTAPGVLHDIITKCVKMDKENRYNSVKELKDALVKLC